MDTSETYIKMCEKAHPILGEKIPEYWDYWYVENQREDKFEVKVLSAYCTDSGVYGPGISDRGDLGGYILLFPIYRQDQLQEILEYPVGSFNDNMWTALSCLSNYAFNTGNFRDFIPMSMEQFWLAFMMKEKYNKVWSGTEWRIKVMEPINPHTESKIEFMPLHPTIEEILAQQRMVLENLSELMKMMVKPPMLYISTNKEAPDGTSK
jgi:hypothetical protein